MRIGIIGAGRIGGGIARQLGIAGHELKLSFSRDPARLERLATEIGSLASAGSPREAVAFGEGRRIPPTPQYEPVGSAA